MEDCVSAQEPATEGTADLHVHSNASDGLLSFEEILDCAEERSLDVVAITDHGTLEASLAARDYAVRRALRVEVVPAMEVTTAQGHVLALFVDRPLAPNRSLVESLQAIHGQGGLAVAAHPLSWLSPSVSRRVLDAIMTGKQEGVFFDGIETANTSLPGRFGRRQAQAFCRRHGLAPTGGSDAHVRVGIGTAVTRFRGRTTADLRRAIVMRTTRAEIRAEVSLRDIGVGPLVTLLVRTRGGILPLGSMVGSLLRKSP